MTDSTDFVVASADSDELLPSCHKPRLGDFSRIRKAALHTPSSQSSAPQLTFTHPPSRSFITYQTTKSVDDRTQSSLGNFDKILEPLREIHNLAPDCTSQSVLQPPVSTINLPSCRYDGERLQAPTARPAPHDSLPLHIDQQASRAGRVAILHRQARKSHHESSDEFSSFSASDSETSNTPATSICGSPHKITTTCSGPALQPRLASRFQSDKLLSLPREVKHQHLMAKMGAQCLIDRVVERAHPEISSNGVYVFLDTSNIQISFIQAYKRRIGVSPGTVLAPPPALDMEFLTKILVRDREVRIKNAGCSYRPGRATPTIIDQLQALEYQVDVRERKPHREESALADKGRNRSSRRGNKSLSRTDNVPSEVHFKEDFVDETLQIRIGEAVMENFEKPGTLVLATGDGKAAEFSDGFFTYAHRALRMGWNVEVVAWQHSLAAVWQDTAWITQWKGRFRIIPLDSYMEEIHSA